MLLEIWLLLLCSAISPSLSLRCEKLWISTLWKLLTMFYVFVFVYFKKSICTTFVHENSSSWPHLSHSDSFPLEVTTYKLFIFHLMLFNYQKMLTFDWLRPVKMGLFWESMLITLIFLFLKMQIWMFIVFILWKMRLYLVTYASTFFPSNFLIL